MQHCESQCVMLKTAVSDKLREGGRSDRDFLPWSSGLLQVSMIGLPWKIRRKEERGKNKEQRSEGIALVEKRLTFVY